MLFAKTWQLGETFVTVSFNHPQRIIKVYLTGFCKPGVDDSNSSKKITNASVVIFVSSWVPSPTDVRFGFFTIGKSDRSDRNKMQFLIIITI